MTEKKETIRSHYDENPLKEWIRLQKRFPYEKYITVSMMERYIRPGSTILDIGGGPGHYSIHFAKQGHTVTLLDLSGENVRFAKKKARQYGVKITAMQGDAADLSRFPDDSFDTVFLMGPLYHLMTEESRLQAIQEAKRVLKPGGFLFCSFILMFGGVIYGLPALGVLAVLFIKIVAHQLLSARGTSLREAEQPLYDVAAKDESLAFEAFTYAWMTTVREAKELLASVPGLRTETVFGQESILSPYKYILDRSPKKIRIAWYEYALRFCEKEEYLTHTEHLMIVSRKGS